MKLNNIALIDHPLTLFHLESLLVAKYTTEPSPLGIHAFICVGNKFVTTNL